MKKVMLVALLVASAQALAAQSVTIPVLTTGHSVTISDDGKRTYLDLGGNAANSYPSVFERMPMENMNLKNFVVMPDGRMRVEGVMLRGRLAFAGESFEFDRR